MDIYAEITKKMVQLLDGDYYEFDLPEGIMVERRMGSIGCHFTCENKESHDELVELLDGDGIPWQEN